MSNNFTSAQLALYWVFDPDQCCCFPQAHLDYIRQGLMGGVTLLQWRAPDWSIERQREVLRPLKILCDEFAVSLIINNEVALAKEVDAAGVHVGQSDMAVSEARRILGPDKIIGLSISNAQELARAKLSMVDYLGIGPVFPTASKKNAASPIGVDGLIALCQKSPVPVVAIGGITPENIGPLYSTGIKGTAVLSAISQVRDAYRAAQELSKIINELGAD